MSQHDQNSSYFCVATMRKMIKTVQIFKDENIEFSTLLSRRNDRYSKETPRMMETVRKLKFSRMSCLVHFCKIQ